MSLSYDYLIIGAGIVGLATALKLLEVQPLARVCVVDKEQAIAAHQTGHNSGVIHSGVYYKPGSLKASLCVSGAKELKAFCQQREIPCRTCGKVIVAVDETELERLEALHQRGIVNGLEGIQRLDQEALQHLEPEVNGVAALLIPQTAIVNFRYVSEAYAEEIQSQGGEILLGLEVTAIRNEAEQMVVDAGGKALTCRCLINCAGLYADRVARLAGIAGDVPQIMPFRGEYFHLSSTWKGRFNHLVYPVPDLRFPFLGIHLTLKMDGSLEVGPNAVLAMAREGYRIRAINISDVIEIVGYRGFWNMIVKYWQEGIAEAYRSMNKQAFCQALCRLIPRVQQADLEPAGAGVRAQVVLPDGNLYDDFLIRCQDRAVHVLNAPSPAATASLAIGRYIADFVCGRRA